MASLDSAYLRLDRGREHLKELKILHDQVCSAQAKGTVAEMQPEVTVKPGETLHFGTVYHGNAPIPDRCRILVGDATGDFRKALDYVVSQLYILAGLKGRTQFPIEGSPEGFRHPRNDFIRKLPAHQIAAIEKLQPYNGVQWTNNLRRLVNLDKHDDLVFIVHDCLMRIETTEHPTESSTRDFTVKVHLKPILLIALEDGLRVMETLEIIESQVTETVKSFDLEFK